MGSFRRIALSLLIPAAALAVTACTSAPVTLPLPSLSPAPATSPPAAAEQLPIFSSVLEKVRPSVVAVNTRLRAFDTYNRWIQVEAAGSGWVYDASGLIVTNEHLAADAIEINIILYDGKILSGSMVGSDAYTDIAVLRIDTSDLVELECADSSACRAGEWVLAAGNSLGLGVMAGEGIITRADMSLPVSGQAVDDLLETSASIPTGNSGGPLLNMEGRVIGTTSTKIAAAGVEGLGYAVSSNQAIPVIEELISKGYVVRPWLGVMAESVTALIAEEFNLPVETGAFVLDVAEGSPAQRAGIEKGDIIVSLGELEIKDACDLRRAVQNAGIGNEVGIGYLRDGAEEQSMITLQGNQSRDRL